MLTWLKGLFHHWPHRDITNDEGDKELYLRRYYLLKLPGFAIYLHRIYRSDSDRHCHDHPWHFVTCVVAGGYIEHTLACPEGFQRCRFLPAWRPRNFAHRLTLTQTPTTTIVLRFGWKPRAWGFHTERGWIHWRNYSDWKALEKNFQ